MIILLSLTAEITSNAGKYRILELLVSESASLLSILISLLIVRFAKVCHAKGRQSDLLKRWLIIRLANLFHTWRGDGLL